MRLCFVLGAALSLNLAPPAAADTSAGQELYSAECAQCHGRAGRGTAVFPAVRGKSAELVSERLTQYRAGETLGPNSALMTAAVSDLTDAEIEKLAEFIAANFP
jgi:cytochrome c553